QQLLPRAAARRVGDRAGYRLFWPARLAQPAAADRTENSGAAYHDRELSQRHAADARGDPAGGLEAGYARQIAQRLHPKSLQEGRKEARYQADLRLESGSAGYAVGLLFRHRFACTDHAHRKDAA